VLLISGSPRSRGNTDTILAEVAKRLEELGHTATFAALRDYAVHGCTGCERCRRDKTCSEFLDGMHLLYPLIESSAGLVLGSPTYNYNITPEMKAFIDRLYPFFEFAKERPGPYTSRLAGQGRCLVVVGISEQVEESEMGFTLPAMREPLRALGYEPVCDIAARGHFVRTSVRGDERVFEEARAGAETLAAALSKSPPPGQKAEKT